MDYVSREILVYFSIMIVVHRVEVSACENQFFFLFIVGEMIFEEMGNFNQYLYSLETSVQQQKRVSDAQKKKKKYTRDNFSFFSLYFLLFFFFLLFQMNLPTYQSNNHKGVGIKSNVVLEGVWS